MATRGAIYVFRSKLIKGISLRHVFNILRCTSIEQSNETIIFTMPRSGNDSNDTNLLEYQKNDDKTKDADKNKTKNGNDKTLLLDESSLDDVEIESDDDESLSYYSDDDNHNKKRKKKKSKTYMERYNIPPNEFKLRVDTSDAADLVYILVDILQESLYGVTNPHVIKSKPKIKLDLQRPSKPTERPRHSLKRRALFLSHYDKNSEAGRIFVSGKNKSFDDSAFDIIFMANYHQANDKNVAVLDKLKTGLDMCEYFKSNWDGSSVLTIVNEFHPTVFGNAFGRAVAWEATLTTVIFRSATFSHFSDFLKSIVSYSENINKIVFLDYERGKSLKFDLSLYSEDSFMKSDTSIKTWWFLNTCAGVIIPFLRTSHQLTKPFDELAICKHSYSKEDTTRIFHQIQTVPILYSTKTIIFANLKFKEFPYMDFKSMCSSFQCLQTLYLKSMQNCDGNVLLSAIFNASPQIHQISLINMHFESNMQKNLDIPQGLVFLDVSKSLFINTAFVSFLIGITYQPVAIPFILCARKLKIGLEEFTYINTIDFTKCQPNIFEINFSYNYIPVNIIPNLFTFLFTQKKIKQIVLYDVRTDDQGKFIKNVTDLCSITNAEGLDIGVHFELSYIQMFFTLLSRCENLTRLSILNCGAGNEGIVIVHALFNLLGNLREFACDGFRPKPMTNDEIKATKNNVHPLIDLWQKIGESKTIERNDWPTQDLALANLKFVSSSRKDDQWIEALKSRSLPKTQKES